MSVIIDGGAGITFPDTVQQTNALTNTGGNPRYYAARAWVNFEGTGAVEIRASANVSSITDNGTGDFTINFTTAMPDANYSVAGIAMRSTAVGNADPIVVNNANSTSFSYAYTTNAVRIKTQITSTNALTDPLVANVIIFR
jgi:hypothetical protein